MNPAHYKDRRAFTLVEMVLGLVILSIVLLACGSAMMLCARAIDGGGTSSKTSQAALSRAATDQIADDLKVALSVTEQTNTAITFTVPDRNGDGQPETIRYAWSGVAGASLTRQYNGGTAVSIADNVQYFDFDYLTRTVGSVTPPPPTEGGEVVLVTYSGGTVANSNVKSTAWPAEYFQPALPGNAVSWKITHIKLLLKKSAAAASPFTVSIMNVDSSKKPTGVALETVTLNTGSVPTTATWIDVPFSTLSNLSPGLALAVVVKGTSSTVTLYAEFTKNLTANSSRFWTTTTNSGSSWATPVSTKSMQFCVYGTITTQ